jgi:integrase
MPRGAICDDGRRRSTVSNNILPAFNLQVPLPATQQPAISSLTGRAMWDSIRSEPVNIRRSVNFNPEQAVHRLQLMLNSMWADSTMDQRRHLVQRWMEYCNLHQMPLTGDSALTFIMSIPELAIQGQLAYAKAFSGTLKHLGIDRQALLTAQSALRAQGAEIPIEQADPITKPQVIQLLQCIRDWRLKLAIMIAWKAASRWGEVSLMCREHFLSITNNEVIIGWGTLPKGFRKDPFRPSMFTVIVGDMTSEIATLARRTTSEIPFCPWTTHKFDAEMKKTRQFKHVTGHSFKHGAATQIAEKAANGAQVQPHELSVLLKHKLTYDLLSATTLRYPSLGPDLARWLGTQRVTALL